MKTDNNRESSPSQDLTPFTTGYRWKYKNGEYIPLLGRSGEQPIDLSPLGPTQAPWLGSFCFAYMPKNCQSCPKYLSGGQLIFVDYVDKDFLLASVRPVTMLPDTIYYNVLPRGNKRPCAMTDGKLLPDRSQTNLPVSVIVENRRLNIPFKQLSQAVGYAPALINCHNFTSNDEFEDLEGDSDSLKFFRPVLIAKILKDADIDINDEDKENQTPAAGELSAKDLAWLEYNDKIYQTVKKLGCHCLNRPGLI